MGTPCVWKSLYSSHNMHIRCHTECKPYKYQNYGEKPYICSIRGGAFSYLHCFEKRERNHSGAKINQCKEYGKILSSSTSLQILERTHIDEKLYQSLWVSPNFSNTSLKQERNPMNVNNTIKLFPSACQNLHYRETYQYKQCGKAYQC